MRFKKKKIKFYKETSKNQEEVAVSSTESVVKTFTSSYRSGKGRISNKNSSSDSREIMKLIEK